MALEKAVITAVESQTILAAEADWLLLTDAVQDIHIGYGSVYAQIGWTCVDEDTGLVIDWADAPTDVKEAVAYFALANFRGQLYPSVNTQTAISEDNIVEITKKLGSMQKTIKYASPGAGYPDPLDYPQDLMSTVCSRSSRATGGSVKLVRN